MGYNPQEPPREHNSIDTLERYSHHLIVPNYRPVYIQLLEPALMESNFEGLFFSRVLLRNDAGQ